MEYDEDLRELRRRFEALRDHPVDGAGVLVREVLSFAEGLSDEVTHGVDLPAVVTALMSLADALAMESEAKPTPEPVPEPSEGLGEMTSQPTDTQLMGLAQFVNSFRREARELLEDLSGSLMGIFSEDCEDAMEKSTAHLHSIRGAAAMVGLDDVAELVGAMESVIRSRQRDGENRREWPAKTLLRAFAILREAVEAEPLAIVADDADAVLFNLFTAAAVQPRKGASPAPTDGEEVALREPRKVVREQPILIVDDVETVAASIGFILSELEVPIEVAADGEEALEMLESRGFSMVISDVDMPRMDGVALTGQIRSDDRFSDIPVVLLTSLDHPEEREAGMKAGATDYLIKGSIGGGDLVHRVRELLEVAPFVERAEAPQHRRILVAEDTETVAASIAFVLSEGPYEIILATDGRDAFKRLQATPCDLLITDMQMPYMSGTELVKALRSDEAHAEIPVVMLTSVQDSETMAKAAEVGVDRYLIKGEIAGGKLLSVVQELLHE